MSIIDRKAQAAAAAAVAGHDASGSAHGLELLRQTFPIAGKTVVMHGDSITFGPTSLVAGVAAGGASDLAHSWPVIFGNAACKVTLTNYAVSGDQTADAIARCLTYTPSSKQDHLHCILHGANDIRNNAAGYEPQHQNLLQALAIWLSRGAEIYAWNSASITYGPGWTDNAGGGGGTKANDTPGGYLTFTPVGEIAYVGVYINLASNYDYSIVQGGVVKFSGRVSNKQVSGSTFNSNSYSLFLIRAPKCTPGIPVIFTLTGITPGAHAFVKYAGSNPAGFSSLGKQLVIIGTCEPRLSDTTTFSSLVPAYAAASRAAVRTLKADGWNVRLAELQADFTPTDWDGATDGVHPLDTGHAKIAAAFYRALVSAS